MTPRTMKKIVKEYHANQVDKAGEDYYKHCFEVYKNAMRYTTDPDILCIALGHDLLEDTDVDVRLLKKNKFSARVIKGIQDLSKKGKTYDEYVEGLLANRDATIVKMSDIEHNANLLRLKEITSKDIERVKKYHELYKKLKGNLKNL